MFFSLIFAHSPNNCPASHKDSMEAFTRALSVESLAARRVKLLDGYVDKLCLAPSGQDHLSYFVFEADREEEMMELERHVRELLKPASVELRVVQRWNELRRAAV